MLNNIILFSKINLFSYSCLKFEVWNLNQILTESEWYTEFIYSLIMAPYKSRRKVYHILQTSQQKVPEAWESFFFTIPATGKIFCMYVCMYVCMDVCYHSTGRNFYLIATKHCTAARLQSTNYWKLVWCFFKLINTWCFFQFTSLKEIRKQR